jgi:catechol 2,3-dioxygenase-like lactoylglutathione lyase family enzyme
MNRIKHIAICAKDQERAAQFYEQVMGLKRVTDKEGTTGGSSIFLTDGYIALAIVAAREDAEQDVWLDHIGFIVDDSEGMFETLQQHQEVDVSTREIKPFYKVRALQGVNMDIASPDRGWPGIAAD